MKKLFKFVMVGLIGLMVIGCGSSERFDKKELAASSPEIAALIKDKDNDTFISVVIDFLNSKEIEDLYKENYALYNSIFEQMKEIISLSAESAVRIVQSETKDPTTLNAELIRINNQKEADLQKYSNENLSIFLEFIQQTVGCEVEEDVLGCYKERIKAYQPIQLQQIKASKLSLDTNLKKLKERK